MGALAKLFLFLFPVAAQAITTSYHVVGPEPGPWPRIFSSVGLQDSPAQRAHVQILRNEPNADPAAWFAQVEQGTFLILEGPSAVAERFGIRATGQQIPVQHATDERAAALPIIWEKPVKVPVVTLAASLHVFAREHWQSAPLLVGRKQGHGAVLWLATSPGTQGHERFPYLLQALVDLGFEPPLRGSRLWAFFDSSYRRRVALDYFAARWQQAGISALQVAAWHFYDTDPENDAYLRELIAACHRQGILVYAWLELPHVSEKFWAQHPEWREQTGLQQDAQLDWRKLMNLASPACFRAAAQGTRDLLGRFDWDGVNLAELYFESLEGADNPARFTPLNADVRQSFQQSAGFDPLDLFRAGSVHEKSQHPTDLARFLSFRADLARQLQTRWLTEIRAVPKPYLDVVLTHIDDRYDPRMRDLLGADTSRILPLLEQQDFTFLIEDPATIWHLGPDRYPQIAARYQPLTPRQEKLAIDVNVVERYQDVYPTKQQTGTELFSLVHLASQAFPRVALYFENSLLPVDLPLLPAAAAVASKLELAGGKLLVEAARPLGVTWSGEALVDGRPWPVSDGRTVWLPAGSHVLSATATPPPARLLRLTGDLQSAALLPHGLEFSYQQSSRAIALLSRKPDHLEIDGAATPIEGWASPTKFSLSLPRGQHIVDILWN